MSRLTKLKYSELPSNKNKIAFFEDGDIFYIEIGIDGMTANMQDNNAAFEAWALVAKAAGYSRIVLSDNEQANELVGISKLHYNRFLYRVSCFNKGFDWFSISDGLSAEIKKIPRHRIEKRFVCKCAVD